MSYCRFSSDNWKSDIYCYEHCGGGFTTHVAGNKRAFPAIPDIPARWLPRFGGEWSLAGRRVIYPSRRREIAARVVFGMWARWHQLHMWSVNLIPLVPIGLPHDGEAYSDDTATECADRLESLRALGYHVPQSAINALRAEAAEGP